MTAPQWQRTAAAPRRRRSVRVAAATAAALLTFLGTAVNQVAAAAPESGGVRSEGSVAAVAPGRAALQRLVDAVVQAGAPGATLLARDEDQVTRVASGVADTSTGRAMRTWDTYRAGSITKTFVATLALQLVQQGRLRLDAPVERYLPGLLPAGRRITVRHLLNHTSGLFNYSTDARFGAALVAGADFTPRQLVGYSTSHPLLFPPGSRYSYTNTGYVVLGLLVQQAGAAPVADQLQARILRPLGLDRTSFPVYRRDINRSHASGYLGLPPDGALLDVTGFFSPSWAWTAGALLSTTTDLADFYRALLGGQLVSPALLGQMKTTVPAGPGAGYGLGIARFDLPCGATWGHDGLYVGYYNFAVSSADGAHQVVLMMNVDPANGLPPVSAMPAFIDALVTAYCGSAPAAVGSGVPPAAGAGVGQSVAYGVDAWSVIFKALPPDAPQRPSEAP